MYITASIFRLWDFTSIQSLWHGMTASVTFARDTDPYRCISGAAPVHRCCCCYYLHHYLYQNSQSSLKSYTMLLKALGEGQPDLKSSSPTISMHEAALVGKHNSTCTRYTVVWWQLNHLEGNGEWRQKLCTKRRLKKEWGTRQRQGSGSIKTKTARYMLSANACCCW